MSYVAVRLIGICWSNVVGFERRRASGRIVSGRGGVSQSHHKLSIQVCLDPCILRILIILAA